MRPTSEEERNMTTTLALVIDWGLQTAYVICLFLGLFYGVFAGLFSIVGSHFGGGDGTDSPGHTGPEVHDMGHEPGSADVGTHMTPFNPVVVAIFLVSFGGTGLATMQLFQWKYASLAVAAPSGFVMAAITFVIFQKFFSITQASSAPAQQEVVGQEAEVITAIRETGLGEIAYVRRGSRFTAPARAEDGGAIPGQTVVKITRIVGGTFYVKPSSPTSTT
jgi:membrane protein implicated in regulation of membrane protease activity